MEKLGQAMSGMEVRRKDTTRDTAVVEAMAVGLEVMKDTTVDRLTMGVALASVFLGKII